jgi:hypothetical protein
MCVGIHPSTPRSKHRICSRNARDAQRLWARECVGCMLRGWRRPAGARLCGAPYSVVVGDIKVGQRAHPLLVHFPQLDGLVIRCQQEPGLVGTLLHPPDLVDLFFNLLRLEVVELMGDTRAVQCQSSIPKDDTPHGTQSATLSNESAIDAPLARGSEIPSRSGTQISRWPKQRLCAPA